ncbi:chemotaxis protein CheX [Desulfurispirillum indicum]|uniref:CheC domain protein n=1 Tax=Desulfurispirillum indicum (strain ATCC BAA-1389 / DSM 22839 / S5) TaxID=653733 RepID=E6W2X3_DESIS|nr:chemotaxis protein CheX [Desulfurispirillum indicum]ADU66798.1 CheC domain protein [Desulfurispirillum indicum S5]UCZ56117.1 chemotaxis protein CheX [Desulfurispirillum indicum]
MNANFINPFVASTISVLASIIKVPPKRDKIFLKEGVQPTYDITAIIGVNGDVHGTVAISFPREVALRFVSSFTGEEKSTINEEVLDALGEFANIVSGGAKRELSTTGVRFKISIPSVITGRDHKLTPPRNTQCIVLPFEVEGIGKFVVEVSLRETVQ